MPVDPIETPDEIRRGEMVRRHELTIDDLDDLIFSLRNGEVEIIARPGDTRRQQRLNINAELAYSKCLRILVMLKNRMAAIKP